MAHVQKDEPSCTCCQCSELQRLRQDNNDLMCARDVMMRQREQGRAVIGALKAELETTRRTLPNPIRLIGGPQSGKYYPTLPDRDRLATFDMPRGGYLTLAAVSEVATISPVVLYFTKRTVVQRLRGAEYSETCFVDDGMSPADAWTEIKRLGLINVGGD